MPPEREVEVAEVRKRGGRRRGRNDDSLMAAPLEPRRPLAEFPYITDEEIYAPLDEAKQRIEAAEAWSEVVHVGTGEIEKSGVAVESGWRFGDDDDIALLHERLAVGELVPDDELFAAAHLDANRLRSAAEANPKWWRMILTWRLTLMVERHRPSSDREIAIHRAAENYVYAHAAEWYAATADRSGRNIFTALQVMTTPVVTVNDQPFLYPGELLDMARDAEMRDLLNRLIVAAWPLLILGSVARHLPVMSTLIDLSLDPRGTAAGWWEIISNPGDTWDKMMKAKEEHGWNFINPAYWSMVHFYESGEAFRRYRETGDPRHAFEGLDRLGQGVGSAVDTVSVATGVGAAVSGPRIVAKTIDRAEDAVEAANKARRAAARAGRAKDSLAKSVDELAEVLSVVSANPYLNPAFIKAVAVLSYELAKTGVTTFDAFIKKLKARAAYKQIDFDALTPEELAAFQEGFEIGLRRQQSIPVVAGKADAPRIATSDHYYWNNRRLKDGDAVEARLDDDGVLTMSVRSKGANDLRRGGPQMVDDVFNYFGAENIRQFDGQWVPKGAYSRNYDEFMKFLDETKSAKQAAWKTWTGQQMLKKGFKRVEIDDIEPGSRPDSINPKFFKDGEPNHP